MTQPADALTEAGAVELVAGYGAGRLSPETVLEAVLAAMERLEPVLNAFVHVDAEGARKAAAASAARWRQGAPIGRLDGVPVSVKDLAPVQGWPSYRGSHSSGDGGRAPADAPLVARLRAEGAVLIGKTAQPELAWKGVTDSPRFGITRNPWDVTRTPGGSSGGASAAIAAGLGALALGTDGSGSIRVPAAFCGIPGLKPTYGVVPMQPRATHLGDIVHAGPMARSVADVALMLEVMAGPTPGDWTAAPALPPAEIALKDLRIAYSPRLGFAEVAPDIARVVDAAVEAIAGLGVSIEQADPGIDDPRAMIDMIYAAGSAEVVFALPEAERARMDPGLLAFAATGRAISATDYVRIAMIQRDALGARMAAFHQRYDLLITPQLGLTAFPAVADFPLGRGHSHWFDWAGLCYPFNLTQQPAMTLPCGLADDGLPVALQIVGPKYADRQVLAAAAAFEPLFGFAALRQARVAAALTAALTTPA